MNDDPERGPSGPGDAVGAWRVTFEYDADHVRIVGQQRVAMAAPPDDSDLLEHGNAGYWVEVRDSNRRSLYCQVLNVPLQHEYEVFSPDPSEPIERVAAEQPQGVFQVIVPDLADGHEIILHGRPHPDEVETRRPRQLVRARLRERSFPEGWSPA